MIFSIYLSNNGVELSSPFTTPFVQLGIWKHLAATLEGSKATIYLNGQIMWQGNLQPIRSFVRNSNFFGNSNYGGLVDSEFDDLKIFKKSLTQSEILKVLNSYY